MLVKQKENTMKFTEQQEKEFNTGIELLGLERSKKRIQDKITKLTNEIQEQEKQLKILEQHIIEIIK
jgi:hypothetical protein